MRHLRFAVPAVCLVLAACGGDDGNNNEPDADIGTSDTGLQPDGSGDDAGQDAADADASDADGADTDGGTDADTTGDVADGSGDADVTEWPFECPRPDCVNDTECGDDGAACIGGVCAPAVEPEAWDRGIAAGVITSLTVGTNDESCCFDLDGDGSIDNGAAALLELYSQQSSGVPLQEQLDALFELGLFQALVTYTERDQQQPVLSLLIGEADIDSDGAADTTGDERRAGDGRFLVDARTLGENGPEVQMALGELDGDVCAAPFDLDVTLPVGQPCPFRWDEEEPAEDGTRCRGEGERPFSMTDLQVRGPLDVADGGISTPEGEALRIGGYIHMSVFAEIMNVSYGDNCACVGLGRDGDLVEVTTEGDEFGFACTIDVGDEELASCSEFQRQCTGIPAFCSAIELLGNLAEVDTDDDGVADSVSFGLLATIAPATLEDGFMPANELCADAADNDQDGLTDCEDPECFDDTNCGGDGWGEQCNNRVDDDGDDLVDCDDPQCRDNLGCVEDGSGEGSGEGSGA